MTTYQILGISMLVLSALLGVFCPLKKLEDDFTFSHIFSYEERWKRILSKLAFAAVLVLICLVALELSKEEGGYKISSIFKDLLLCTGMSILSAYLGSGVLKGIISFFKTFPLAIVYLFWKAVKDLVNWFKE